MPQYDSFTPDIGQKMHDAGAITANGAGLVGGVAKVKDVGPGMIIGQLHVRTTAVKISATNERYDVIVQGSNSPTFASGVVPLGQLQLGMTAVIDGTVSSPAAGIYNLFFTNSYNGTIYQYIRVFDKVAGTSPSFNYEAWLSN